MREYFEGVLKSYGECLRSPFEPKKYKETELVLKKVPEAIVKGLHLDEEKYTVQGSVGMTKWAYTPWVSIFDKEITQTAQKGFYVVYLFRKDLKGFYLSLNQGTMHIEDKYKGHKPRGKMREIAKSLRGDLIYNKEKFPLEEIELAADNPNPKNYMAAHICGKYYDASNIPSDEKLFSDLEELLAVYLQLKSLMMGKSIEEMHDFYLQEEEIEDIKYQSDILVARPRTTKITKKPQPLPEETIKRGKKIWKRDSSIAKEALQEANFLCELDPTHLTFKSKVTNENFVEAHHLIPMKQQSEFHWSLDVPGNIMSLCPNCHRKIHHASKKEKKVVVKNLYDKKTNELDGYGIHIPLKKLMSYYGC
ncbi:hypothetical protein CN639_23990 [Bacillus toyonensis]|uniref:MrcB family domain-containing protein n=1 Tax=Bacillus toyonensis TaxID=155322 RepID=UPI000BF176BB|nr:DUF3578 domain-containing protein [Bacillus toyonensis]MCU5395971.1 DUF3578 domain-containing protein [Bacillus toyonensis]PEM82915.1 hypothetical protein CN639_23990 [Bacillus toyonensis]